MKQIIRVDMYSVYTEKQKGTWQAYEIRRMTGTSASNWLFKKENSTNTLILDAQITVHHLNVRKYASEKVWEAAMIQMEQEESE